ncbi:hypothetical protein CYMTET_6917 [Cymbomonas tetramitiformis]|uniref:Aspartyl/asparaginy/proline hydroxylase domain-containing protein n=1 Tax=Cymbomonas tetramitiformis TaxID=36881 RepID=A0AAE0GWA2_9CHLO|nr:hypothetical protein CYMTET_6917 [Cymbomonas tetramitiformis]
MDAGDAGWRCTSATKEGWRQVVAEGVWRELVLYGGGRRVDENCALCPRIAAIVDQIPEATTLARARGGEILLSILEPGTHLRAHCGPSNNRLTVHLGLVVPDGCKIRVAGETREWTQGKCLAFDDSFEHEVWHKGSQRRVVLLMNIWHPDITPEQKESSMEQQFEQSMNYRWH